MSNKENFKIGLLLDSFEVAAWEHEVIARLGKLQDVEIVLIILITENTCDHIFRRIAAGLKSIVYRLHCLLDEKLSVTNAPNAFDKKTINELLANIETVNIVFPNKSNDCSPDIDAANKIAEHHLDLIVYTGTRNTGNYLAGIPKYGLWFYELSDDRRKTGMPSGYWEVVEGWNEIGVALKTRQGIGEENVLHRLVISTDTISISNTKNICAWKAVPLLPRKVKELSVNGADAFFSSVDNLNSTFEFASRKTYGIPNNIEAMKHALSHLWRVGRSKFDEKLYLDQWCIFFKLGNYIAADLSAHKRLIPGKERFWADPFLVYHEEKYYIFIEELIYSPAMKGFISVIEVDKSGNYSVPVKVLEKEYNLSYPFVFQYNGKYFMIPETYQNSSIEVYECIEFPYRWCHMMNLMEGVRAVDTTLHFHNNKWWLFTAMDESGISSYNNELYIFYADTPFTTQWISHPCNPVISDVKKSRPAGRIFSYRGKTYRPSQDCAGLYGKAIKINEIRELTENSYEEVQIAAIEPGWDPRIIGAHTFAYENGLTVIDCALRRNRLLLKWERFMRVCKRTEDNPKKHIWKGQKF